MVTTFLLHTAAQVWHTFAVNWPFLLASIVIAAAMKALVDQQAIARLLTRHRRSGVVAATALGVTTPLCSCGTTAIVLGMMASMVPWAPIVAFMVASPLTSPEEYVYSAALFGWRFATVFFVSSIVLGIAAGAFAYMAESAGLLNGQARMRNVPAVSAETAATSPGRMQRFGRELVASAKQLTLFFTAFAFVGYALNGLIPSAWIVKLFGSGHVHSVPLAATLGIPMYLNTEASLPLLRPMLDAGMSPGAALAFLITGAGTSIGAIVGAMTIARWRVIAIVVGTLWTGAIVFGFAYDAMQAVLA